MEQWNEQDIQKALYRLARELHLGVFRTRYGELDELARKECWSHARFLYELMLAEHEQREENAHVKRLKTAGFPQYKYLEELDLDELPEGVKPLIPELTIPEATELFRQNVISGGMIPKVECCIDAIHMGVKKVIIMDGRVPHAILMELLTDEGAGTMVIGDENDE